MWNRLAWFVSGIFTGAVLLYLVLWHRGMFTPLPTQSAAKVPRVARETPRRTPPPEPDLPIPQATSHTAGGPGKGVIPPIENLQVADILETFSQARPGGRTHEATDIMAPLGTPVHAMVDGVIEKLFLSKPGGNTVYEFDEAQEYCYYYAHLDHYAEGIQEQQHVRRGTVIGYVGTTGNAAADAPHLHIAVNVISPDRKWWKGTPVDPYPILLRALDVSR